MRFLAAWSLTNDAKILFFYVISTTLLADWDSVAHTGYLTTVISEKGIKEHQEL